MGQKGHKTEENYKIRLHLRKRCNLIFFEAHKLVSDNENVNFC